MSKVLVICPEAVPAPGVLAAGPGIRYWNISRSLSFDYGHDVTLAVPASAFVDLPADSGPVMVPWDLDQLASLTSGFDCVVLPHVHSGLSTAYRQVVDPDIPTAVDLYDPVLVENIGLQPESEEGARSFAGYLSGVVPLLKRGDYFFCANTRQRYYYIGVLNTLGRINPLTYASNILEIVPFGVEEVPAKKTREVMRGSLVGEKDPIILWFSGIYPWFDAYTLIEAMPLVVEAIPAAKLVVMGGVHPLGHAPEHEFNRTKDRAVELGLIDKSVFFVGWQPYEDRGNWYLESDLAVTTHKQSLETELSHRTRVIDFLWGGLPVVTSSGDAVGEFLEDRGCGVTVGPGDAGALAEAIIAILGDEAKKESMGSSARQIAHSKLAWRTVVEPLARFCADPKIASDRVDPLLSEAILSEIDTFDEHRRLGLDGAVRPGAWARAKNVYRTEGARGVLQRLSKLPPRGRS